MTREEYDELLIEAGYAFRRAAWAAGKEYRRLDEIETFMQGEQWPPGPLERPDR